MSFQGYKLNYKAAVFRNLAGGSDTPVFHVQNLEMSIFITSEGSRFHRFDELERRVKETIKRFSDQPIDNLPPFDKIDSSLENIGQVFFTLLNYQLEQIGAPLERLEISENLIRTYIVTRKDSEKRLTINGRKMNVNDVLMAAYISSSISSMLSEIQSPDTGDWTKGANPGQNPDAGNQASPLMLGKDHARINAENIAQPQEISKPKGQIEDSLLPSKCRPLMVIPGLLVLIAFGTSLSIYLFNTGLYPSGADIYGHLFKSDLLYNCINEGDYYPLYTEYWYNGLQPFRYWAPFPYYLLALLQFAAGGDPLISYLFFVTFAIVAGGFGWLLWGIAYNRHLLCTCLAVMWFFMPDNMRVFFVEGNLPRMVIAIFLPYLFFFIWRFAEHRRKGSAIPLIIIMCIIVLCHVMIAAMIGITAFIFLLIYSISQRRVKEGLQTIALMLLSFSLCGIWLYPALQGGLVSMDASATAEVMKALSTKASVSLNPFLRNRGLHELFYFGISILALSIFGFIFGDRKSRPGFLTSIVVFIGTLPVMVPVLDKLPMNQLLWMTRFTPVVYAVFLLSLLQWKKLRRYAVLLFVLILILDSLPSINFSRYYSTAADTLSHTLEAGKKMTSQRISLMDLSTYGSYPSFGIATEDEKKPYTYGWAWQGASTAYNIMMLNSALERGYYHYLFDRSLETGDDTVLVQKQQIRRANKDLDDLMEGAAASEYRMVKETNDIYIFNRETPGRFGLHSDYKGLTIGSSANLIALEYPVFEEGARNSITDYTLSELEKYEVIYLSGFEYEDKKSAEDLLKDVADAGVKIIIDMNRIPSDPVTNRMSFLDVYAQPVSFSDAFPTMIYKGAVYEPIPFSEGFSQWNTVYLENIDAATGYSWIEGKLLPFTGSKWSENITFLGYNFLFHAIEAKDEDMLGFITDITEFEQDVLPERKVLPLSVEYERNRILIKSPQSDVNTTIGFQDIFESGQEIKNQTNLLLVGKGLTEIELVYPYLKEGLFVSAMGLIAVAFLLFSILKKGGKQLEKKPV
ncbi:6-pyruvoyl-tetrahydropterin synthase-related protein [Bacillota bacterium]